MKNMEAPAFMNRCLLFSAIALMQTGCNPLTRIATEEEAKPLSYVGQIAFGEPTEDDGHVVVPLEYSGGDWNKNSAIVPSSVDAVVVGDTIELAVRTSVAHGSNDGYRLVLPGGTHGKYTLRYRDPDGTLHEIGTLEIAE